MSKLKVSEEFESAIISGGSIRATCELCGREHFESEGGFDEGELEGLRAKAKKDPDKYIETQYGLRTGYIAGKQVVAGCLCGKLATYENFITLTATCA